MGSKPAVRMVQDIETASLLVDPTRRLILHYLAMRPMTGAELARILKLTPSTISFQLKTLGKKRMVRVVKTEAEAHGIPQKYFEANAVLFFVDPEKVPPTIRGTHLYAQVMSTLRGVFTALRTIGGTKHSTKSSTIEELIHLTASAITENAKKYANKRTDMNHDELITEIYTQALLDVIAKKENDSARFLRKALAEFNPKFA